MVNALCVTVMLITCAGHAVHKANVSFAPMPQTKWIDESLKAFDKVCHSRSVGIPLKLLTLCGLVKHIIATQL